ncbi:MAG: helix-turn-helix transcriptional regulator [Selenomonadaceae bacterium]|nr:helix-turn-helix transcriptional regulator [Selenomonadaceae bacterium]
MKDRVRQLRTEKLGLTQKAFGQKIGLGTQAINDIEKGRNALTDRNIEAICNTFGVNPDWLRNGAGEIFLAEKNLDDKETLIRSVKSEFDLNDKETMLLRTFLNLEPQYRTGVLKFAEEFSKTMAAQMGVEYPERVEEPLQKTDSEMTLEEAHAQLDAEFGAKKRRNKGETLTSLVSTGTNGLSKKFWNSS